MVALKVKSSIAWVGNIRREIVHWTCECIVPRGIALWLSPWLSQHISSTQINSNLRARLRHVKINLSTLHQHMHSCSRDMLDFGRNLPRTPAQRIP
jgi:hypothetical protein